MKTIKQIADELGVSKDKARYQVRKLPSDCIVKRGNITYLTDGGAAIIKGLLAGKSVGSLPYAEKFNRGITHLLPTDGEKRILELEAEVEQLKWQLDYERASAEEKIALHKAHQQAATETYRQVMDDIKKWQELFEREQQLRMADKASIIQHLTDGRSDQDTPGEKPGFFARIFRR
jgi:DNA-binding Lrp family transcriptional regulator